VHALPTSGVVYADIAFNLSYVPEDLLPLLPLFSGCLKQLGTVKGDFADLIRRIGMSTGGISTSVMCMNKKDSEEALSHLIIRGKAMSSQVQDLAELIREVALTTNFDDETRVVQLLSQARASAEGALISSGHMVAGEMLAAQTTRAGWLNEHWGALKQYYYLGDLLESVRNGGWASLREKLSLLQECIFHESACAVVNITSDAENLAAAQGALEVFASSLPAGSDKSPSTLSPALHRRSEGIIVPTQVNYVGKGGNLYKSSDYKFNGSAMVISKHLGATYLWDRVRVSGGAYGGFCRFDPRSGDFKYLSYRDPNLSKTLDTYDGAAEFLKNIELGEEELSKAIIGCIGDVDKYQLPDAKGFTSMLRYLAGEDDEYRQKVRDEILGTTVDDFRSFASALESVAKDGGICVVGSKEAFENAQAEHKLDLTSPFAADVGKEKV
jgi:hypothetical protein